MRIGKTRIFQSMKYVLPALALLVTGAFAIIKDSFAVTCSDNANYYICYASTEGGYVANPWNDPEIYGDGNDGYPGNGARALADPGYKFVAWKDSDGQTVSTNSSFTPCNYSGCSGVFVEKGETYTAYFERDGDAPVYTCTGYFICYAAEEGGQILNRDDNNQKSGESNGASSSYAGRGARAVANSGYEFVDWKNDSGATVSTNALFIPCGEQQGGCEASSVNVKQYETFTAYFRQTTPAPTAATETITLGAIVDSGALNGKTIALTLSALEDGAPMPSSTQASISSDTTSVSFGEITFAEEGTWRYRINLQTPSGVTVDASNLEVRVRATLDQANNTIVTEKTFYKNQEELTSEDDFLVRVHAIPPTAAEENISLTTSVENGALEGNEAITLTLDGTPAPATTSQAVNKSTTSVSFGEISFTEPGSYRYRININNPYATAQPDATNLEVKIDAILNTDNNAIETSKTYYKNNSEVSESDFILNILLVEPTPAVGHATFSDVIDSEADTSNFTATMTPVGGAPIPSNPRGEIVDGTNLSFGAVEFTEPGYYEFVVELKNGDKTHKIKLTADLALDRRSNTLQFESGDVLDEDGTAINNDKLREIIAELLASDQTPDDDQGDSGDDSEDESVTPSPDNTDSPNTVDTINVAAYGAIGAAIFLLGLAIITKKR